ncbi:MAG: helix-turn-helix transcriptional regulator [Acetobacteraceae bacterium]|nr:helix-turn-helix transcriptional regulator [Acetobacteraceae bacterium]
MSDDEGRAAALRLANEHIGRRLAELRARRRLSLEEVGHRLGVSYQQVQKYEKGESQIAAARLVHLALVLDAHPREVLGGLPPEVHEALGFLRASAESAVARGLQEEQAAFGAVPAPEWAELQAAFLRIQDPKKRALVVELARTLAG